MKNNSIYRWRYNEKTLKKLNDGNNGGTTYWCVSQIGIYNSERKMLIDTYWSTSDNRKFTNKRISDELILEYVGNLDNLKVCDSGDFKYYKPSDCININHSNMWRGGYYLKKNAKRSLYQMKKNLRKKIKEDENNIEMKKRWLEIDKERLLTLKIDGNL